MSAPTKAPSYLSDQEEWEKFKTGFNRNYDSSDEEAKRFNIFQQNLQSIREHNEKFERGETTFTQGINQFTDLTKEEFKARHTGLLRRPPQE
uniref:Cathepsin L protease inhibitor 2 n=1 Tax=Diaprepes abbreviatus TaxID=13040 RepID=A7LFV3_DIAAB|nr:cathepsin L protease inhibitor 2 [Diaprepes abbreviatus]